MRQKLTALSIDRLPYTEKGNTKVFDESMPGFGVRITAKTKSFFVMMGKERKLKTIGRFPEISLSDARKEARRLQAHLVPETRSGRHAEALSVYLRECEAKNAPKTVGEYRRYLSMVDDKRLSDITRADIDMTSPHQIMAWRVYLNWCVRNELVDRNPFLHAPVKYGQRERILTDAEIAAIWQYEHAPYSDIVKLLILTGQRRNQIWKYDPAWLSDGVITFPSSIMKSSRPHALPVTGFGKYLQQFSFNSWSKSKRRMDAHTGVTDYVLHDFRRYFSTTMAKLGVPLHVTEQILDHRTTVSGVAAIYNRHSFLPEMKDALLRYEEHIANLIAP